MSVFLRTHVSVVVVGGRGAVRDRLRAQRAAVVGWQRQNEGGTTRHFVQISTPQTKKKNKAKRFQTDVCRTHRRSRTHTARRRLGLRAGTHTTQNDFRRATLMHDTNHHKRSAGVQGSSGSQCVNEWVSEWRSQPVTSGLCDCMSVFFVMLALPILFPWDAHNYCVTCSRFVFGFYFCRESSAKQRRDNTTATKLFVQMTLRTLKKCYFITYLLSI